MKYTNNDKVIQKNILDQCIEDIKAYAIYISRCRALPHVKDGLKPIHRRILTIATFYCTVTQHVKSSSIVGRCMDLLHPHGDSSIYEAMQSLTNWFQINYPLLNGQGNFGNFQGGKASAMRYTESKISQFSLDCVVGEVRELKNVVDWKEAYNNKDYEPEFFAPNIPLLLVNGIFGIALGIQSSIPRHNLGEVIDATINLIKNPNSDVVLVPDHCMPCDIVDTNFKAICNTGIGSYKVRGRIDIVEEGKRKYLVIRSLPDYVYLDKVIKSIEELIKKKKIVDIEDITDRTSNSSNKKNAKQHEKLLECYIRIRKDADPEYVREFIFKNTQMENSYSISLEVVDDTNVVRMGYKTYLEYFIQFRKNTKFRYYSSKIQLLQTKIHEKDAFIKLLQSSKFNSIIDLIRNKNTSDDKELIEYLVNELNVTDLQAEYIINASLKKLSPAYLSKYIEETNDMNNECNDYINRILNDNILLDEIIEELKEVKRKYNKPRNCSIISKEDASGIPKGNFTIIVTKNNNIKKLPLGSGFGSFKGDTPKTSIDVDNRENLLLFGSNGRVYKLPVSKIPVSERSSNGTDVRKINNKITADIISVIKENSIIEMSKLINVKTNTPSFYLYTISKKGLLKRISLEDFTNVPPSGIIYTKLDSDDYVHDVNILPLDCDIIVYYDNIANRININDIPYNKRSTKGSKAINSDNIDGVSIINSNINDILVITAHGRANRINSVILPTTNRSDKKTNKIIKLNNGDRIISIIGVSNNNQVLNINTNNNTYNINVSEIKQGTSVSTGVKLISSKVDSIVNISISK